MIVHITLGIVSLLLFLSVLAIIHLNWLYKDAKDKLHHEELLTDRLTRDLKDAKRDRMAFEQAWSMFASSTTDAERLVEEFYERFAGIQKRFDAAFEELKKIEVSS